MFQKYEREPQCKSTGNFIMFMLSFYKILIEFDRGIDQELLIPRKGNHGKKDNIAQHDKNVKSVRGIWQLQNVSRIIQKVLSPLSEVIKVR